MTVVWCIVSALIGGVCGFVCEHFEWRLISRIYRGRPNATVRPNPEVTVTEAPAKKSDFYREDGSLLASFTFRFTHISKTYRFPRRRPS